MKKKGFLAWDMVGWWAIGLAVLVIVVIFFLLLSDRGQGLLEYFKTIWRFR